MDEVQVNQGEPGKAKKKKKKKKKTGASGRGDTAPVSNGPVDDSTGALSLCVLRNLHVYIHVLFRMWYSWQMQQVHCINMVTDKAMFNLHLTSTDKVK